VWGSLRRADGLGISASGRLFCAMASLRTLIDGHTHSQFSWDASGGCMLASCKRADELGLGGIAFTEHADLTAWVIPPGVATDPAWEPYREGQTLRLPQLDLEPYLAMVEECRRRYPKLTILSGVEISEPHWHSEQAEEFLADDRLDRVISSVHACPVDGGACESYALFAQRSPGEVLRTYLEEVRRMIETTDVRVLAHIDYAARYWPDDAEPLDLQQFEREHRDALAALAARGGALEINTRRPLETQVLEWWIADNGNVVTFGSDSHAPHTVAAGLPRAAALAARLGFHPAPNPQHPWQLR